MLSSEEIVNKYQVPYQAQSFYKRPYNFLATPLVKFLTGSNITANQITILWVAIGFLSTILYAFGNYWLTLLAFLLLQFHIVLDSVDGPLARIKNCKSSRGVYIEAVGHSLIYSMFFFCIALGSLNKGFSPQFILTLGFSSSIGFFLYKYSRRVKLFSVLSNNFKEGQRDRVEKGKYNVSFRDSLSVGNSLKNKSNFLNKIYRNTQLFWEPVPVIIIANFLALFDLVYLVPIFYGLTYPIHFFISYVYQSKIGEDWVYAWIEKYQ